MGKVSTIQTIKLSLLLDQLGEPNESNSSRTKKKLSKVIKQQKYMQKKQ
jgi:hypothetical protein